MFDALQWGLNLVTFGASALTVYKDRITREEALSSIAISISYFNTAKTEIGRKIHIIRSQNSNERTKLQQLATPGSAGGSSSKWQHFAALEFLKDSIEARSSKSRKKMAFSVIGHATAVVRNGDILLSGAHAPLRRS